VTSSLTLFGTGVPASAQDAAQRSGPQFKGVIDLDVRKSTAEAVRALARD
jgi:hypothetical protein